MFTYIYLYKYYRLFKSGFLLDFFFKKITLSLLFYFYSTYNIFFSEKYLVEFIFNYFTRINTVVWGFFENLSSNFSYLNLSVILIFFLILSLFILYVEFALSVFRIF